MFYVLFKLATTGLPARTRPNGVAAQVMWDAWNAAATTEQTAAAAMGRYVQQLSSFEPAWRSRAEQAGCPILVAAQALRAQKEVAVAELCAATPVTEGGSGGSGSGSSALSPLWVAEPLMPAHPPDMAVAKAPVRSASSDIGRGRQDDHSSTEEEWDEDHRWQGREVRHQAVVSTSQYWCLCTESV
jgi:hypothetical protein